jgi:hypothetical protein
METVTLDALDAVELIEILEYLLEGLDVLVDHDLAPLLLSQCSPYYSIDDVRDDVVRLIHRLHTGPLGS